MKDESKVKGALARAGALTPEQRQEIAQKAAEARWSGLYALYEADLSLGGIIIPCAVLEDGTRVLSERGVTKSLGGKRGGSHWRRKRLNPDGANLPVYLSATNFKPFISKELEMALTEPIRYRSKAGGGVAFGINAEALPQICAVLMDAKEAGRLLASQELMAENAKILFRAFATVGITALIDEATGYQDDRDRLALQVILDKFLKKEYAAWAKRFPDEFYRQIFRLRNWQWRGRKSNPPGIVARYTNDLVYERLAPGILKELEARNPVTKKGRRLAKHHQWLTDDVGHPALAQHLGGIIGLMRISDSWEAFKELVDRAYRKQNDPGQFLMFDFDFDSTEL